jgi:hypothetical protein
LSHFNAFALSWAEQAFQACVISTADLNAGLEALRHPESLI